MEESPRNIPTSPKQTETAGPSSKITNDTSQVVAQAVGEGAPVTAPSAHPSDDGPASVDAAAATVDGAGAAPGPSRATRRTPRTRPTTDHPDLPATAAEVKDLASFSRVVTALSTAIIKAVQAGKSVTSSNKKVILLATEETRKAMDAFQRLAAPALTTTSPSPATVPATSTLPPEEPARESDLRRDLVLCVREEIGKLKAELSIGARTDLAFAPANAPRSYAQAFGSRPARRPEAPPPTAPPPALRVSRPAIIVAAKAAVTTQQQTVEAFRRSVSFRECDYAPAQVRPVARNKLRVEFDTGQQRDEALQRLSCDAAEVTAERARSLRPMLLLKGITRSTPKEELVGIIRKQNGCPDGDLKLKFIRKNRNAALYNAVVEASGDVWRRLFGLGRVCVDHQRVQAERFSPFVQCYSCLQFGHVRGHCAAGAAGPCARCASAAHQEADCPLREQPGSLKCVNCHNRNVRFRGRTPTDHKATSASCPVLCAMRARIEGRVDYGPAPA